MFFHLNIAQVLFFNIDLWAVGLAALVLSMLVICLVKINIFQIAYKHLSIKELKSYKNHDSSSFKFLSSIRNKEIQISYTLKLSKLLLNILSIFLIIVILNSREYLTDAVVKKVILESIIVFFVLFVVNELYPRIRITKINNKVKFCINNLMIIKIAYVFLKPLAFLMQKMASGISKLLKPYENNISMDDISDAIDFENEEHKDEKEILEGIINFSNIEVKAVMRPRIDVVAIEIETEFVDIINIIKETKYSRIPIYEENFDNVKGVLYIKDLLPYINAQSTYDFEWQKLIRPFFIVPETKKINDLLSDFQAKKLHMAIVTEEYGGTSGIITLEDIIEEIVGEIDDEYDNQNESLFDRLGDNKWEFIAKTSLSDFCKILSISYNEFDAVKGDSDSLAGLILELKGEIPKQGDQIKYNDFTFTISEADERLISKILVEYSKTTS